jgi:predicted lysophospholipase L1 biosynthesis ABC-type transport system permease subunit
MGKPIRRPMPLRFMFATVLAMLPLFVLAVFLWDEHNGWAVTCAITGMAVIVGNYYVRSSAWRDGTWPGRHR